AILPAPSAGYISVVSPAELLAWAADWDVGLSVARAPGEFLLRGDALAEALDPPEGFDPAAAAEALARQLGLSDRQEIAAGALYEARALAEGAIRALSPGINDPGTALSCANRLFDAAARMVEAGPSPAAFADENGRSRVAIRPLDLALLCERALSPMCRHGRGDAEFRAHAAGALAAIADRARVAGDPAGAEALL
ncbi:MAG: DUF2254 family protein, partial [Pseudomonadota bacterium]